MLYWIIPYLVAYNASSSGNWKYGPEHVFKAEVHDFATHPIHGSRAYASTFADFVCRPMNSSLIQCRIDSAKLSKYEVKKGADLKEYSVKDEECGLDHIVFQIKFDEEGISRVWFLNNNDSFNHNMIRAIIGTMNMGISFAGKKAGNYVSREKSIIGICDTNYIIKNEILSESEEQDETEIEGYEFIVPSLGPGNDDQTIVIEKDRHPSKCVKKTPYLFGSEDDEETSSGQQLKLIITKSQSRFNIGENSFSTYTKNVGTIEGPSRKKSDPIIRIPADEIIHVTLQSIRPAKDEHWSTENLVNAGAGFEPGTPWPRSEKVKE